jgi:tetratricopeptide (TPR) repeat protein
VALACPPAVDAIKIEEVLIMKKRKGAFSVLFLLVFTLMVLAAPAAVEKKMSRKAEKLMTKAREAVNKKQLDQAIGFYRQIIAIDPENAIAYHDLGVLLYKKGQSDEAIANFEETLRLQKDFQNAMLELRQTLYEAGKNAGGIKEYEKSNAYLLKLVGLPRPDAENKNMHAWAQYLIGCNFFNLKQYDKASEFFVKCQNIEGLEKADGELYANTTYYLGMLNSIQGQYALSNEHFKKYQALFAGNETKPKEITYSNYFIGSNLSQLLKERIDKGDVSMMTESARDILPYLISAIEMKILSEDAYVLLGNCYVYLNEYDNAVQTYQKLIELFPQSMQLKNYQAYMDGLKNTQQQLQKPKKKR